MKTNAGVWIDHREAVIVALTDSGEETMRIQSNVERQFGHSKSLEQGSHEDSSAQADDSREREYTGHLAPFYDEIISHLSDAGSVLIFGPGEAKGELKKRFDKHPNGSPAIALETTDKMTDPQIVALVRHHFHRNPARQ
jgi:hypothetical protein